MLIDQRAADRFQIVAGIKTLRDLADVFAECLAIAEIGGARERIDLGASIIDIIFAGDGKAGEGEEIGERVAEHRTATMADMHRTRRVGRDIFDIHHPSLAHGASPKIGALLEHHAQHARPEASGERQIDETGASDFDPLDVGIRSEQWHDALGK